MGGEGTGLSVVAPLLPLQLEFREVNALAGSVLETNRLHAVFIKASSILADTDWLKKRHF